MFVSDPNNVKIYNLSAGKSLPEVCFLLISTKCCNTKGGTLHQCKIAQRISSTFKLVFAYLFLHVDLVNRLTHLCSSGSSLGRCPFRVC
jgi:hypothetical protein